MSSASPVQAGIGLGANLGRRRAQLRSAVEALASTPEVVLEAVSSWIRTEPVGGPADQPSFWNGAALVRTSLEPRALLARLLEIELSFGRDRSAGIPDGPRTLDLDLLFYGRLALDEPGLVLPHPRMEERVFVLEPLAELVPERLLDGCGLTVADRLAQLTCRSGS